MSIVARAWTMYREQVIIRKHRKVAAFWNDLIEKYTRDKIKRYPLLAKMDLPKDRIIWQYWGQGIDSQDMPDIVRYCFRSVDCYKGNFTVIRIDDSSITQYLDLPDFILDKKEKGVINRTFFSDLLRLALLKAYGGVWLDATILLTKELPVQFHTQDYFVYQRDPQEQHQEYWKNSYAYYWGWNAEFSVKMLNSIIFAKQQHPLISLMLHLLLSYWETSDAAIDYFFYQILHEQLAPVGKEPIRGKIMSDVKPHLLQTKLSGGKYPISYPDIFKSTGIHKLTYFDKETVDYLRVLLAENCGIYLGEEQC